MSLTLSNVIVVVKSENAKHLHVPMYKTLTVDTILEYGRRFDQVKQYLPDERDMAKLPRQWVINVVYSLCSEDFREWVSLQVKDRNDRVAEKRELMIELDPEIAAAFGNSANISSKSSFNN